MRPVFSLFLAGVLAMGGTLDPARVAATDTIARGYGTVTPADLQALAINYLRLNKDWSFVVLPTPAKEAK